VRSSGARRLHPRRLGHLGRARRLGYASASAPIAWSGAWIAALRPPPTPAWKCPWRGCWPLERHWNSGSHHCAASNGRWGVALDRHGYGGQPM